MVRRGLEACERLSPLCLYVLGRLAATLPSLYKHVSVRLIQLAFCIACIDSNQIAYD